MADTIEGNLVIRAFGENNSEINDASNLYILTGNEHWNEQLLDILVTMKVCGSNDNIIKCYVAEIDSKVVGLVFGYVLPNEKLLPDFLYVHPCYRNQGIGEKLNRKLEEESGCTESVIYYRKELRDYYGKMGFTLTEKLEVAHKLL